MRLFPSMSLMALMSLTPTGLSLPTEPVSLSKFTPRIENLPASCQEAYNAPISGCTRDDFPKERNPNINNCSGACVSGLVDIVALVNEKCAAVRVPRDSIIGVALVGDLLPKLCGGLVVVTEGPGSVVMSTEGATSTRVSSAAETTSKTAESFSSTSQSQATGTGDVAPSSATPSKTTLSTSTSLPPTSTSPTLTLDTSTPPPPPPPSQTTADQEANIGGSPFDIVLVDTSSAPRVHRRYARMAIVGLAVCALLAM